MSYDLLQNGVREGLFFSESCSIYDDDDDDYWPEEEEEDEDPDSEKTEPAK